MVLNTDMTKHFTELNLFRDRLSSGEFDPKKNDKNLCMDMVVHIADLSGSIRPFDISK